MAKKKKKTRRYISKKVICLIILCFVAIVAIFKENNVKDVVCFRAEEGLYYRLLNKNYLLTDNYSSDVYLFKKNSRIIYDDQKYLYSYVIKSRKKKVLIKYPLKYFVIKDKYILIMSKDNHLYISNGKKVKKISDHVMKIVDYTNKNILYRSERGVYNYSINNKKSVLIKDFYKYEFSKDKKNLLLQNGKDFTIYSLKKNKVLYKYKNVDKYYCIKDDCSSFYYIKNDKLYKANSTVKKINLDVSDILYIDSKRIIYAYYNEGRSQFYYRYKNQKSNLLDENIFKYSDVYYGHRKIGFRVNGNYKEVKRNGKSLLVLLDGVEKVIGPYKNGYILVKNSNLYYNDSLIAKNVDDESININDKCIYYKVRNDTSYSLYKWDGKKYLISKNVGQYKVIKNDLYYISDYNLSRNSGILYLYKNKKSIKIKNNVTNIIDFISSE